MLFSRYRDKILLGSKGHKVPFVFLFDVFEELWARLLQRYRLCHHAVTEGHRIRHENSLIHAGWCVIPALFVHRGIWKASMWGKLTEGDLGNACPPTCSNSRQ